MVYKVLVCSFALNLIFVEAENKTLRWGIAGAGRISHDFVVSVQTLKSGHEIVAVGCQSNLERAKQFAQKLGINTAYGTYGDLARDPNVDVVYVGNLNPAHAPTAKLMLASGKHVLCEKPLTLSAAATRDLVAFARNRSRFLMEAHWDLFQPATVFARDQLRNGAIGEVRHVTSELGLEMSDFERVTRKRLGGGTLVDLGVYALNNIQMAFGLGTKPESIKVVAHRNDEGVDLSTDVALKFSNWRSATFAVTSQVNYQNRAFISGTNGTLVFGAKIFHPDHVTINGKRHDFPYDTAPVPLYYGPTHIGLKYEAEEVRKCLAAGQLESHVMTHAHSIFLAEQVDDILKQIGVNYDEVEWTGIK